MRVQWINRTGQDISQELQALGEVTKDLLQVAEDGTPVYLERVETGFTIRQDADGVVIAHSSLTSLMRAVGLFAEQGTDLLPVEEKPAFSMLGSMIDCSRNAVMTVETVKRVCRIMALMGHNSLMLYTEDTYEMEGHPYFGYMRGRYTAEELKECDDYAALLGIELIPCIQTLAHLNAALRWPDYWVLRDCEDILLVDDERTYQLIDDMLCTMSSNLRSRRIHIGMDEAHMLGLGEYLQRHGYQNRSEIMLRHLKRVVELCNKYGYQPIMWSDMFFRLCNPDYYSSDTVIEQSVIDLVPENLTLTYWDYYHTDEKVYDYMIEKHQQFKNPILFAGGAWSWTGLLPMNRFSIETSRKALVSLRKHKVEQVLVTVWGDNGGTCPVFSVMPTLQLYAEACWNGNISDEHLEQRLKTCAGMDLESFMALESPHFVPGRDPQEITNLNPTRYLLFQDVLCGLFDRHVLPGTDEHYAQCAERLECLRDRNPRWTYLFDTAIALCHVMRFKSELGIRLKAAYDAGDRKALSRIAQIDIPALLERLEQFHRCLYTQWTRDNKIFGMDVQDIRLGALRARIERAAERVNDYVAGRLAEVDELKAERMYLDGRSDGEEKPLPLLYQYWVGNATASVL